MNSLSAKSQNYMPLSLIIGELLCFWVAIVPWCFTFEVSRHLLKSLLFAFIQSKYLFVGATISWVSLTLNRFTHSTFLDPSCEEFFLWFLNFTRLANENLSCWHFPEVVLLLHMCGFSLAHSPWPVFWEDSLWTTAALRATLGQGWSDCQGRIGTQSSGCLWTS